MNKLKEIQYYNNRLPGKLDDNLLFYFSFDSGNSKINPISGKSGLNQPYLFSGEILPSVGNFWNNSGYGYINNNYIKVNNVNDLIDFQDFTFICVYENIAKTGATLLSTVSVSTIEYYDEFGLPYNDLVYKGFEFGFTSNSRLFFEFYDSDGPKVFTSNFDLADKSSVFLNVSNKNAFFGYYNFIEDRLISNNFNFNSQFIFDPENLFIGKNPSSSNLYNYNKQFEGLIEQTVLCSPGIFPYEIENINKAFASKYISGSSFVNETLLTGVTGVTTGVSGEEILLTGFLYGITGYTTGVLGINTGVVTGIEFILTGTYEDEFGNLENGYQEVQLFGDVITTGFVPLTGILKLVENVVIEESVSGEGQRLAEFGKNNLNLLSTVNSEDTVEIQTITGNYNQKLLKNISSFYDNVNKNHIFTDLQSANSNINYTLFANGLLTTSGSKIQVGNAYSPKIFISGGDYILTKPGEFLFSNLDSVNSIFGDFITGSGIVENTFSKTNSGILNTANFKNYNIYFNGQKLTENIHFTFQSSLVNFNLFFDLFGDQMSGKLILIPKNFNSSTTGSKNLYSVNKFYNNYSQVYKNGVRQRLNFDYIENGTFTLNNGSGILDIKNNSIYNNDQLFN
jgi:hypothetical protein